MSVFWHSEACDLVPDPVSGAALCRLTYAACHNTNLYFEQPHTTPDGRRVAYGRSQTVDPRLPPTELCVADLATLKVAAIDNDIVSTWFATSPWSGKLHTLRSNGELLRVDLATLEREIVVTHWPLPPKSVLWSVTPDMRFLLSARACHDYHTELIRVDLDTAKAEVIYRRKNVLGHMQINHHDGRSILVQVNRGIAMNHMRDVIQVEDKHPGATHIVVDLFDGTAREMPLGEPYTAGSTGHATWVAGTGRIATPVRWENMSVNFTSDEDRPAHDPRHPDGNFIIAGPDDDTFRIFPAPDHLFDHASMSRCGRYFVADCVCHGIPGPVEVVAGNIETGKSRVLVSDTGATMGGPACSHVHPFLTADNRHVIYNADPHGLGNVYKARVPDGFWKSLS